jgi:hypothetical protein
MIHFGSKDCRHATVATLFNSSPKRQIAAKFVQNDASGVTREPTSKCSAECSARFAQPAQNQERGRLVVEHRAATHLVFDGSFADPRLTPSGKDPRFSFR